MINGTLGAAGFSVFESFGEWAWRASWQGAAMAIVVAVLLWMAGKRISPAWRFWLWALVLARLAMPAVVEIGWIGGKTLAGVEQRTASDFSGLKGDIPASVATSNTKLEVAGGDTVLYGPTNALGKSGGAIATIAGANRLARMREMVAGAKPYVLMVWLIGLLVLALRIGWSSVRLARAVARMKPIFDPLVMESLRACCRELKISRVPAACELPGNGAPALVGFWRPRILLPRHVLAAMAGEELRLILLHELAHVKRRDVLVNWIATVIAVIHWFNPAAWLVGWRMRVERELACDELVLRMGRDAGGGNVYARTIVKLVEALSSGDLRGRVPAAIPNGAVGILEGKAQIQRRLVMIARYDAKSRRWPVVAAGFGLLFGALALSGVTRAADNSGDKSGTAPPVAGSSDAPKPHDADHKAVKKAAVFLSGSLAGSTKNSPEDEKANARAAEKLRKPVPEVNFNGQGFADVIDFFRDASGVDFVVEWDALANAGVTRDTPVTIRLHEATSLDAVLSLMFRSMGGQLQHEIDRGVVVIGPSQRTGTSVMRVYDVSGLVATRATGPAAPHTEATEGGGAGLGGSGPGGPPVNNPEVQQLISLITSTIQREIWTDNGGGGATIGVFKTKLVVKAPENVHKEIVALLEDLQEKPAGKGK